MIKDENTGARFAAVIATAALVITGLFVISDGPNNPNQISAYTPSVADNRDAVKVSEWVEGIAYGRERQRHQARAESSGRPVLTTTTTEYRSSQAASSGSQGATDDIWWALAGCETGYTYDRYIVSNTNPPYYSYFQWEMGTWRGIGGTGHPFDHDYESQKQFAIKLQQRDGWGAWPYCSRKLGLRG